MRPRGFTFIELLVVIVVMGILAALALPRLQPLTNKGRLAALQSDVRNAEYAEEAYFADAGAYGDVADLQSSSTLKISPGVTLTATPSPTGYTIQASNPAITEGAATCEVEFGNSASTAVEGKITCL
jgi:prepilin-type N-terminal cleavage/methylation domain-containing protein